MSADQVRVGDEVAQSKPALSREMRDALLGTLLGDASLAYSPTLRSFDDERKLPVSIQVSHSESSGLTQHKVRTMPWLYLHSPRTVVTNYGKVRTIGCATPTAAQLSELVELLYDDDGRKKLPVEALKLMGPIGFGVVVYGRRVPSKGSSWKSYWRTPRSISRSSWQDGLLGRPVKGRNYDCY